jgi:hypothetical protein
MRRRRARLRTDHGEHGLNVDNVGFLGGEVVVTDHREIGEVLVPRPVSVDEVLHLISPPNGSQEMLPNRT